MGEQKGKKPHPEHRKQPAQKVVLNCLVSPLSCGESPSSLRAEILINVHMLHPNKWEMTQQR